MKAKKLQTVRDIIEALKQHPMDARVVATWEGITRDVRVYPANDMVYIDADEGDYQAQLQELVCECGAPARGFYKGLPYCYTCWEWEEDNER
jgi:hypothetical protein